MVGFNWSMRALVAWRRVLFLIEGKIVVLFVSSLFLTQVGVYVCVSVCIRTHTHTLHRCLDVSPGVGMRHLEGPKNPDGLNLGIHIFVYVYKVHMCIYMLRGGMRSWTNCFFSLRYFFFRKRKAKDMNANHRSSQILIPKFERIDPQSGVLNYNFL